MEDTIQARCDEKLTSAHALLKQFVKRLQALPSHNSELHAFQRMITYSRYHTKCEEFAVMYLKYKSPLFKAF